MGIQVTLDKGRVPVKIWTRDIEHEAIQQLVKNAINLSPKNLSQWLDNTQHTADDRSVQDQKISSRPYLTAREFEHFTQAAQKMLTGFQPAIK